MFMNFNTMLAMWILAAINFSIAAYRSTTWTWSMAGFVVGLAITQSIKWYVERD